MSFLSLDGTFWVQILNFFIFYAILNVVYIRPASQALRRRRQYIDSVQAEYDAARHAAREIAAQAEEKRAEGRREGDHVAATIRAEAMRQAEEIVGNAQAEFVKIVDEAQDTIVHELNSARTHEPALVRELADGMLARAIGPL